MNDDKDTITIAAGSLNANAADGPSIDVTEVRVDVSSLDAGDEVIATISTTAASGLIPVGQSRRGSVAAVVATVRAGLTVEINGSQSAHL